MKNALIIFLFTSVVTLFYYYVGQMVPQNKVYPPEVVDVTGSLSIEQMVEAGQKIVTGKCMSCHGIQPRFPALQGVGGIAGTRKEGTTDVEYLAESLYDPDAFIVPTFAKGMTAATKPPLSLNDREILTVIAYLQSLGGTPSVSMDTKLKYQGASGSASASAPAAGKADEKKEPLSGEALVTNFGCAACHSMTTADRLVGPSLYDVGKKLSKAAIYEAIMDPDATIAEGFFPGMMGPTLLGAGFYEKVSSGELKVMVDYLFSLKGGA